MIKIKTKIKRTTGKRQRKRDERAYRAMRLGLAHKSAERVGKTRRGRKKHRVILFPYPKRGKHRVVDGVTIKAE